MKAVVLAAGRGTRLGRLTENTPKPMVRVSGKPVLEHILLRIRDAGVCDVVLITQYLGERITDYFGDGSGFGIRINYVRQPEDRYGTGAALLAAREAVMGDVVMMTYGDVIISGENYAGAIEVFRNNLCDAVMTLNWVDDPCTGAAVYLDGSENIRKIVEKPPKGTAGSNWNSAGIFVFRTTIFDYLAALKPSGRGEYELPDAMNAMIADGFRICPYYLKGMWKDIGRPEDIAVAERLIKEENENAIGR